MRKTALISSFLPFPPASPLLLYRVPLLPPAAEEAKTDTIGPWEIEATFKGDKFDRCTITRKLDDDIVATFVRPAMTSRSSSPRRIGSSIAASSIQ